MKKTPIVSMSQQDGWVEVVRHSSRYMFQPLAEQLLSNRGNGSACVLTQTNDEAVIMTALLQRMGMKARLIQSLDGFRFYNLAEVRYFISFLERRLSSPLITDELWEAAKTATFRTYATSTALGYLRQCVEVFAKVNRSKYLTDFKEFVFDSAVDDFIDTADAEVMVSTIHKSKGREFGDVYMLLTDQPHYDDALMRRYYVGITRAKRRLFIHTGSDLFKGMPADRYVDDRRQYSLPDEVTLQLSHRDVNLDFFLCRKRDVISLRGGDSLVFRSPYLYTMKGTIVARLSARMLQTLEGWRAKGYEPASSSVRFVVAWKKKDAKPTDEEAAVLLPDMVLKRKSDDTFSSTSDGMPT